MSRNIPLIHIHVTKTAGSAIRKIIGHHYPWTAQFGVDTQTPAGAAQAFLSLPARKRNQIEYVHGHMQYGFHKEVGITARYLTMLRDPVERIVSHYHHVRVRPRAPLHARVHEENVSLAEYVTTFSASRWINNGHVRYLGARSMFPKELPGRAGLERAKERLANGEILFGLVESFDDSLRIFARSEDWAPTTYRRVNENPHRPLMSEIDPELRALIAEANGLDVELYRFACGVFEARLRSTPAENSARQGNSTETACGQLLQ